MNKKKIAFDTNTLLEEPSLVARFAELIVVPGTVLDELDRHKTDKELGKKARAAIKAIDWLRLTVITKRMNEGSPDKNIIAQLLSCFKPQEVLLVSNDRAMCVNARSCGIETKTLPEFLDSKYSFSKVGQNKKMHAKVIDGGKVNSKWVYCKYVREYDENKNIIHYKDSITEWWATYDADGKILRSIDDDGSIRLYERDEKGRIHHATGSDGWESWSEYDAEGREILNKDTTGQEFLHKYDENGNCVYEKEHLYIEDDSDPSWKPYWDDNETWYKYDSDGKKIFEGDETEKTGTWYKYDKYGNLILIKSTGVRKGKNSCTRESRYEYDANKNPIHEISISKYGDMTIQVELLSEYDTNGNCVHTKCNNGDEMWYEYNANGDEVHYRNNKGFEHWTEYDENGNIIHCKHSIGLEVWYDYEFYPSGSIKFKAKYVNELNPDWERQVLHEI